MHVYYCIFDTYKYSNKEELCSLRGIVRRLNVHLNAPSNTIFTKTKDSVFISEIIKNSIPQEQLIDIACIILKWSLKLK